MMNKSENNENKFKEIKQQLIEGNKKNTRNIYNLQEIWNKQFNKK